jgi:hypothetical protein
MQLLLQQSASSTFEGSPAKPIMRRLLPTAQTTLLPAFVSAESPCVSARD